MQYLPVFFAVFQIFFLLGLVIYYIVQSVLRILVQAYITRRFYAGDESLGRQAQAASVKARELSKSDGGGGLLAQAKRELSGAGKGDDEKSSSKKDSPADKRGGRPDPRASGGGKPSPSKRTGGGRPSGGASRQADRTRPGGSRKR
jgi:YidC/Oxa1 family membrane protein insertase